MQKRTITFLLVTLAILIYSCGNSNFESTSNETAPADITLSEISEDFADDNASIVSSSVTETNKDSTKKIIKTADLKFKSKDAINATYNIEDLVRSNGGFVESSEISKNQQNEKLLQTAKDSALQVIHYVLHSNITLRVPQQNLDTLLKQISTYIDFLESRNVTAEDATLTYFDEQLKQRRAALSQKRIDSLQNAKRGNLNANISAEDARYNRQLAADEANLHTMKLDDKVNFSTIHLTIYEDKKEYKATVPYIKDLKSYKPDFGIRFIDALKTGWNIFLECILILTSLWWLLLTAIALYILIRNVKRARKNKS